MENIYNITNQDVYFAVNSIASVAIFLTIVLPALILCILCLLGVICANLSLMISFVLVNLFISEVANWLLYILIFLGFPLRYSDSKDMSCKLIVCLLIVVGPTKIVGTAVYSVVVYIFFKCGIERVKCVFVVGSVFLLWAVAIFFGQFSYDSNFFVNNAGFCEGNANSLHFVVIAGIDIVSLIVSITFGCLTAFFLRGNALEGDENATTKKYIAKHLFYVIVSSLLALVTNIIPGMYSFIRASLVDRPALSIFITHYLFRVFYCVLWLFTPVATIVVLKPVQVEVKKMLMWMLMKVCAMCWRSDPADGDDAASDRHLTDGDDMSDEDVDPNHPMNDLTGENPVSNEAATDKGLEAATEAATIKGLEAATNKGLEAATDKGLEAATNKGLEASVEYEDLIKEEEHEM